MTNQYIGEILSNRKKFIDNEGHEDEFIEFIIEITDFTSGENNEYYDPDRNEITEDDMIYQAWEIIKEDLEKNEYNSDEQTWGDFLHASEIETKYNKYLEGE